ncbi:D-lactate dehydrogenase (cytochrome) [Aliiroseovarius halocynthiae]|uniref:D-lactate dehydrogenase (cytochrome) n=1 Tax=Aliiroseovarius halocynthiae TaxID=985055 RepID=A0A545SVI6_9RHOB|nr:FAD-linked oxidase C-terminal domain-containing protein [Aliiroseovarius halocynthiae]TQV68978.1 FAD-binding protein [Aliiroseovarius halocynthiae]SMR71720.1 D-lactate dehydrogenase (cytochrome) [Aliiroseovarius halocynthiae]
MAIDTAFTELSSFLGDRISRSKPVLDQHGGSETHFAPAPPDIVVWPKDTSEISRILRICNQAGIPVIPFGAGTSLEGHTSATKGGVCLDMARMNRVLSHDPGDMIARVEAGLTREELNHELRAVGVFFPVDPGANATLGGMAATRASGTTTVRYGSMRQNVLGLTVVLADGRVIRTGSQAPKSSSGYDLTALFLGSEGTLGIITELTLRLHGQPEEIRAGICAFPDMASAVGAVQQVIQMGLSIARIEFVDDATARAFNQYAGTEMAECPHLLVEFHGSPVAVSEANTLFDEISQDFGATGYEHATKTEDRNALWKIRHHAFYAVQSLRPGAHALVTDICVPISKLADAVEETRDDIEASILPGPILGHVGDGNFHAILLIDPESPEELAVAKDLAERMSRRALALGGTITGEHGIGMGKLHLMAEEHGDGWAVMGDIKSALDPRNILNPGKLVPQGT